MTRPTIDRGDVPWPAILVLAGFAAALMVSGCGPNITVAQPDVTITPPAALMQPFEPMKPFAWTDAKTAPIDDGSASASAAATAPKAPGATVTAPKRVIPTTAPAPGTRAPVSLIPPANGKPKETGPAPMPTAPPSP